jgi:hypothetical protein
VGILLENVCIIVETRYALSLQMIVNGIRHILYGVDGLIK